MDYRIVLGADWTLYTPEEPPGITLYGTVVELWDRDLQPLRPGAFGEITETHEYVRVKNGCVVKLRQKRAIDALTRAGRPPVLTGGRRVEVYLDDRTIELARKLGDGNLSAGLRKAFKHNGEPK
jgi:hypothetical protein